MAFQNLAERFPSADAAQLGALAGVWNEELDRIIKRMLEISANEGTAVLPEEARHGAIFELAKLTYRLEESIIEKKTERVPINNIDPQVERAALSSREVLDRIENTARICADRIWKPLQKQWLREFPLIAIPGHKARTKRGKLSAPKDTGVRQQHYSPSFSNRYWASGAQNKLRVYDRGVDLTIRSRDVGYKTWGQESFIYSQSLERHFHLVETDASTAYSKLLDTIPLSEDERRHWIAYLVVQLLRTPSYIARSFPRLRRLIIDRQIEYPKDVVGLRNAYETLFTNDEVFASFYRVIVGRRWRFWVPPAGFEFIRSDDPVLIEGSIKQHTWRLVYPMTPFRCFVAGPEKRETQPTVVPLSETLSHDETRSVNVRIAGAARRSVVARISANDSALRALLEPSLGISWMKREVLEEAFKEYWGSLE
jgi:hypothetical protein